MDIKNLFGTSGIRGDSEKLFTNQFCFDIGRVFSLFLAKHGVSGEIAIGNDPRGSSPRIIEGLINGLLYEGRIVLNQGAVPSPAMCYVLHVNEFIAGSIMVTGSHIKSNLNGVKFFAFKAEILKKHEGEINNIYANIKDKVKQKTFKINIDLSSQAKEEYTEMLMNIGRRYPKWKVVVDCGNGSQSDIMPQVLTRLGVNVIEQNDSIQGEFYARDTENVEDLEGVIARVPKEKADFGIAYDADGDRVVFFGKDGTFIPGDYTAAIVAKYSAGDSVVTPIATSSVVDNIGKKVIRTKVGSPYVVGAMVKNHSKFGFEANGGAFSGEIMLTRDGGSTSVKLLNIMAKSGKSLEELVKELPKYYISKAKVDYKWELQDEILEKAKVKFKGIKVDNTDGLKIWIDKDTWMLFRSSQNAPEFRIFAESKDKKLSEKLLKEGLDFVKGMV